MLHNIRTILISDSLRQVGIYTITGSLCKAISFAAFPLFINYLSEGDIGILTIFSNCIVFFTPVISMGVLYTLSVDYFKLSKVDYAKVFTTSLFIPAALSLLLVPVLYLLRAPLSGMFGFQPAFIWLIPLCLFLNFCYEAFIILVRNQNNVRLFTTVSFLKIGTEIGVSVLLILWLYQDWYGRALGFCIAGLTIGALFFHHANKEGLLVKIPGAKLLKKELSFGLSGMVLQTAIFFINTSDKFFMMSFFGKEQAGFYAVAGTFATVQYIVCTSLLQYLQPVLFRHFAEGKRWKDVKHLFVKYISAMGLTFVMVNAFTVTCYTYLLPSSYTEHLHYFYLLSVSSFLWTVSNVFLQFILFDKSKRTLIQLSVICIVTAVSLNYFAAEWLGINGLAAGQIIINVVVLLILFLFNRKLNFFS